MIVDTYHPDANFVRARLVIVEAAADRVWRALPELPATLRQSRWAALGALPLHAALRLSAFYYYGTPLLHGLQVTSVLGLMAVSVAALALGALRFARKDIGV